MKNGDVVTVSCELETRSFLDESFTLYPCSFVDRPSITELAYPPGPPMGLSVLSLWTKGYELYEVKNYTEAIKYFKKSADQGYDSAQTSLGNMYRAGLGVTQSYSEAVRLYRLAADQGYAIAQYNLGTMYENGEGVTRNYSEARKWYTLSANQGNDYSIKALERIKNK